MHQLRLVLPELAALQLVQQLEQLVVLVVHQPEVLQHDWLEELHRLDWLEGLHQHLFSELVPFVFALPEQAEQSLHMCSIGSRLLVGGTRMECDMPDVTIDRSYHNELVHCFPSYRGLPLPSPKMARYI